MFRITNFQEILKGLPRYCVDGIVARHKADKYIKGFGYWAHLVTMIYAQLSGASSLRDVAVGLNSQVTHHYHLGVCEVKKSTLADANGHRKEEVFVEVAVELMRLVSGSVRRESKAWLNLLDSTPICLKGREFDRWTKESKTRRTQGLKLHVLYDTQTQSPSWQGITGPNVNDITKALEMPLKEGAIYVFDKGYCDYGWWEEINQADAQFVTRFKSKCRN